MYGMLQFKCFGFTSHFFSLKKALLNEFSAGHVPYQSISRIGLFCYVTIDRHSLSAQLPQPTNHSSKRGKARANQTQ